MAGNDFEINAEITTIFIDKKNGAQQKCLIDTEDLEKVMSFPTKWKTNDQNYVHAHYPRNGSKNKKGIKLHRYITGAPDGLLVDHINHDTLDNRKSNLRIVTKQQNCQNKSGAQINSKSGIRGVVWNKAAKKWRAQYKTGGKAYHVGSFDSKEEAAKAILEAREKAFPYAISH